MTEMTETPKGIKKGEAAPLGVTVQRQVMQNRCCCGKYKNIEFPFISNGILHDRLGVDDAFCGPVVNYQLRNAESKLNKISSVVNAALLTTTMRMNSGPEVFISGSRFIEAKSLEDVLSHIAELLVA